jgi:N-hydroxyarylamine O-acetyltransferase
MFSVPFENLDIHLGHPILLGEEVFFKKIVDRRRGGFCYELNGLFAALLRQIGFEVAMLSAGVARPDGGFSPDFDHMALLVRADADWLADVGFGDSFIEPVKLDQSTITRDETGAYRIMKSDLLAAGQDDPDIPNIKSEGKSLILQRSAGDDSDGAWNAQYQFSLEPRRLSEYEDMCRYQQTSPESHFTQNRICSLATPTGRITVTNDKLITTSSGLREERTISGDAEFNTLLSKHFRIYL